MQPLIERVYLTVKNVYKMAPLRSYEFRLTADDYAKIREKALEPSNFAADTMRSRPFQTGPYRGFKIGEHTLYVIGPGELPDINLFSRILQSMGTEQSYTIYHFLSQAKRRFPPIGQPVDREHINGGYCMACKPETIVIYRAEDAVRVLIHELQHAACCDNHQEPVPIVEAKTEAWAELIYAMFMAIIHRISPMKAWSIQSGWSASQNNKLRIHYSVLGPQSYAWRYTVGKEDVWKSWNLPLGPPIANNGSLVLGVPEQLFAVK
jgi:hypothetical protein